MMTQPLLTSGQPAPPNREHYSVLKKAVDNLLGALVPFAPIKHNETPFLPNGWWLPDGQQGAHQQALRALGEHVKVASAKPRLTGRPPVEKDAVFATHELLTSYNQGFGKKPAKTAEGPTFRFVRAFFAGVAGEWCSRLRRGQRFSPILPTPQTIPTLIATALSRLPDDPPYWQQREDREGLFPDPYRRPSDWNSNKKPSGAASRR
jgi:hypothetical protein